MKQYRRKWWPPPTLARSFVRFLLFFALLGGGLSVVLWLGLVDPDVLGWMLPTIMFIAVGVESHFEGRKVKQLVRLLEANNGHLCPRCEHPLLPPTDGFRTCTECGLHEPEDAHMKTWKSWWLR